LLLVTVFREEEMVMEEEVDVDVGVEEEG